MLTLWQAQLLLGLTMPREITANFSQTMPILLWAALMLMGPLPVLLGSAQQFRLLRPMKMTVIIGFPLAVGMVLFALMPLLAAVTPLRVQMMVQKDHSAGL